MAVREAKNTNGVEVGTTIRRLNREPSESPNATSATEPANTAGDS
jgi:hypothetical protein